MHQPLFPHQPIDQQQLTVVGEDNCRIPMDESPSGRF